VKYVEASRFGGPEVLTLLEKETPKPAEGMLLVEVQAAGINYADVLARSGHYPAVAKAPFALGFEIASVVKEVGKHVEGFKVGDSVAALTLTGGGYASHILIPAATAIPFPKQLAAGDAARRGKMRAGNRRRPVLRLSSQSAHDSWRWVLSVMA
jgi:NADPH:quinone reductase